jgi:hypothetical protein
MKSWKPVEGKPTLEVNKLAEKKTWQLGVQRRNRKKRSVVTVNTNILYILVAHVELSSLCVIHFRKCWIFLVEVGLRAQNAIWNFRVPRGIISNTFKVKIFFSCCLSFTTLELSCHNYMENPLLHWPLKILIPFIILGARPTSNPGPKRDQLVTFLIACILFSVTLIWLVLMPQV